MTYRFVPKVETELSKKVFKYAAPSSRNNPQKVMKLSELFTTVILIQHSNLGFISLDLI